MPYFIIHLFILPSCSVILRCASLFMVVFFRDPHLVTNNVPVCHASITRGRRLSCECLTVTAMPHQTFIHRIMMLSYISFRNRKFLYWRYNVQGREDNTIRQRLWIGEKSRLIRTNHTHTHVGKQKQKISSNTVVHLFCSSSVAAKTIFLCSRGKSQAADDNRLQKWKKKPRRNSGIEKSIYIL